MLIMVSDARPGTEDEVTRMGRTLLLMCAVAGAEKIQTGSGGCCAVYLAQVALCTVLLGALQHAECPGRQVKSRAHRL